MRATQCVLGIEKQMAQREWIHPLLVLFGLAALGVSSPVEIGERAAGRADTAPAVGEPAEVRRVIDGDTLVVHVAGKEERVRLLGIDTPELPRDGRRGEFLAVEAAECSRDLTSGKAVLLIDEPQRENRDDYDRLLRYVRLPDGRILNAELIRRGYARVFTRYPFERQQEFLALEAEARAGEIGLWAAGGRDEIEWNLAHGVLPIRLHPTTNWSWAIEFEGRIKTGVAARELLRELRRLRRSLDRGDPARLHDRLSEEGYLSMSPGAP
jgi:micrococcal nuclease